MAEIDRLSQYRYLIRAMRVEDKRSLESARALFHRQGIDIFDDGFVFRHTPHNEDFIRITDRFFGLVHNLKVPGRRRFDLILEQYLVIFFDEVCCESWDRFLVVVGDQLATGCAFCSTLRDLRGHAIDGAPSVFANRKLLAERFGDETEPRWASLEGLAALERRRPPSDRACS